MRTAVVIGVSLILAAAVAMYAADSHASSNGWIVQRYYTNETWNSFADIGRKDNGGPGDVYTSQQSLTTTDGKPAGTVNGFGINLHKPFVFFHWTADTDRGTLTIEGAIDLSRHVANYPIAGGTGAYAGARGTVAITDVGKSRSLVVARFRR